MVININVQYSGGLLPDIILLTQGYYFGGLGGGMLPDFFFCSLFPVQQTTSGIGHRVK